MASFADFLATFDADPKKRGRQFEHFVKWFLKNDPEWATQVDEVWLWNDYPGQWGRDCGIDLVFRDKTGSVWAVQAKCYSPSYEITKADVDKFLSESNRKEIHHRLLIATTDGIGANARQVLAAQEKSVVRYHLADFENAAVYYPNSIERLSVGKRKPPPEPRPHQIEAIENVISGFRTADRGQLVMACGTGKTFVCLWVKERVKAKRTLVLVPSLGLLSQILNDWTFAAREQFDALCVCSDQTVNRREEDEAISLVSDLPFPVSSDVAEIAHFLKHDGDQVIFSTYQSSPLIAEVQKNHHAPGFDLVIADEAHRCAGKSDTVFGTVLDDGQIKSERHLFATATPRVYKTGLKKAAEELGVEVVDMSDEKSFGKRFHNLTFGEAINRDLLTDYRVLIVGVDNERVKEWIENRSLVATDTGLATDARSLAGQIGLLKAVKDWNLRRVISFHGRVKRAKEFSEDIIQVAAWLDGEHRPSNNLWAEHVSGEMPTIVRRQRLKRLRNLGKDEIGLLSNARCLSEGVDVPALDGVAFIDPRSSEIDIIQSVGRAIRLSENKTMGTIVLPVFIEQTDNAEEALEASEFKPIWDVLEALKSHDDRLSDELDQLRIELGAKGKRSVGASDLTKIVFDLPTSVNEDFAQSLRAYLVAQTTGIVWMFSYGVLGGFVKENGHCRVRYHYKTDSGFPLGHWVAVQKRCKDTMDFNRRQRLEALPGWSWDVLLDLWTKGFAHLTVFSERMGHCRVADGYKTESGYPLGNWVGNQRRAKDTMDLNRRQRLEALPGWWWTALDDRWEESFARLRSFSERMGHCRVPDRYKTDSGYPLGPWVGRQRKVKDTMDLNRRQRLEALPGWSWDVLSDQWEEGFSDLKKFSEREGHCRVTVDYRTEDGHRLGLWVRTQRLNNDKIDPDRRRRLEALPGWWWTGLDDRWEESFAHLKEFSEREAHCRVRYHYKTDSGNPLGHWVAVQKRCKDTMDFNRRQRLEALPGWSWDALLDPWNEGFAHLTVFSERMGHCRVADGYKTDSGYPLGPWVRRQRTAKDTMDPDRRQRLEALPGWWWTALDDRWEESFAHLRSFSERMGHCRVPDRYKTDGGYPLGNWVGNQRKAKDTLDLNRRQRLEALPGWSWDVLSDQWEEGFSHLKKFSERMGHCRVAYGYKTDSGYPLGNWVAHQRRAKDTLDLNRRQRLEALPGWSWTALDDRWEESFAHLKEFSDREGHCRVPYHYKTDSGYPLGHWVAVQRRFKDMDLNRRQRLEALPGWSWDVLSDQWEEGFAHLTVFSERMGHCRVADGYKTDSGYALGNWVRNQRRAKDTMDLNRRQLLEALPGWSWTVLDDRWEEGFAHLRSFSERMGHCRVPDRYKTDGGYPLGPWVGRQRKVKDTMDLNRRQRLEALPGWSSDVLSDHWEEGFSDLKKFSEREGHCRVTVDYRTEDGHRLGLWVKVQRRAKDKMDRGRRQRLEALPGWVWKVEE